MDGHQAFLRPAQHPFYIKKPLVFDSRKSNLIDGPGYIVNGKPSAHSVDLAWYNYGKHRGDYQFSEPYDHHSVSIREVFAKAILSGDVQLDSPEEETVQRNPSFITSSLPRRPKESIYSSRKQSSPLSPTVNIDISYKGSSDYFLDSSSESENEGGGHWNDGYSHDDSSLRLSDDVRDHQSNQIAEEEPTHFHPIPSILDISGTAISPRSTISGLFKPKYKETTTRNNVHRNIIWDHQEVKDSTRSLSQTPNSIVQSRLPRTPYPEADVHVRRHASIQDRRLASPHAAEMISHNKYLPSRIKASQRSLRLTPSPRKTSRSASFVENETNFDEIQLASVDPPESISDVRIVDNSQPIEQMEIDDPQTWAKERQRARRKQRRKSCIICSIVFSLLLVFAGIGVGIFYAVKSLNPPNTVTPPNITVLNTTRVPNTTTEQTTKQRSQTINLAGQMSITNLNYTSDHRNNSSSVYQNMSRDFCLAMGNVFSDDPAYVNCSVQAFSQGSLITQYTIAFDLPLIDSDEITSQQDLINYIQEEASSKIRDKVEANEFGPPDRVTGIGWNINKESLILDAISLTTSSSVETTPTFMQTASTDFSLSSRMPITSEPNIETTSLTSTQSPSTTVSIWTTPLIPLITESVTVCPRAYKKYPVPNDCTKYRQCTNSGLNQYRTRLCPRNKMFVASAERSGRGDCQRCDPEVCQRCAQDDDDNGPNGQPNQPQNNGHRLPLESDGLS